jgi:hypothetical protein
VLGVFSIPVYLFGLGVDPFVTLGRCFVCATEAGGLNPREVFRQFTERLLSPGRRAHSHAPPLTARHAHPTKSTVKAHFPARKYAQGRTITSNPRC